MQLRHDTCVIVADAARYPALRNHGDEAFPDLRLIGKKEIEILPA